MQKQELMDLVLEQIKQDFELGDSSGAEELVRAISSKNIDLASLENFLTGDSLKK